MVGYLDELGARKAELRDPARSGAHYKELERRFASAFPDYKLSFASAFPDYKLSYMTGYSVYGLVNTLAE